MAERQQFLREVRRAAEGTPYVVTKTDDGFDVTLDVVDAHWFGLYDAAGLRKVYVHHVTENGDGTYAVTDDSRTVEWEAGVPRLSASVERSRGRVKERSVEKVWAFNSDGDHGKVVDYRFDSEEGRTLIEDAADRLELTQRRGGAEKIGLVFALIGGVGAVLAVLAVLAMELLGS